MATAEFEPANSNEQADTQRVFETLDQQLEFMDLERTAEATRKAIDFMRNTQEQRL